MLTVGLTGGIGAGKSEVSRQLAALGAVVVDADLIAREVVAPGTDGLAAVVAEFGTDVLLPDGSLDRPKLGAVVFADPARLAALNAIVHPLVGRRSAELAAQAGPGDVVVHDVPLLAENKLSFRYQLVVVVDAADDTRLRRLVELRGMAEAEARARMAAQASREERLSIADLVIDNDGPLERLGPQVDALWADLRSRASAVQPGL
jgi:dephospho-CoA kinase